MTTNSASKKTQNLISNPKVSLLVHDWVSHRPPTRTPGTVRDGSPPPQAARSSLASLLLNINTSAMSRISATINGDAKILDVDSEEEKWCKSVHLENNTFGEGTEGSAGMLGTSPSEATPDGGRGIFIENEAVRVVVVQIRDGRISDWKGAVQDFAIAQKATALNGA